jgi:RNA-binding protein
MRLSQGQRRHLKGLAHALRPVVMVGQAGVTPAVLAETERALDHHELVKVRVSAGDRDLRDEWIGAVTRHTGAELVQRIGNVAVLFRRNPRKPRPLPLPGD